MRNNENDREDRDGSSSFEKKTNESGAEKKKRPRLGDLRKQSYDVNPASRERNPYTRSNDDRSYNSSYNSGDRPSRPSFERRDSDSGERRPYNNQNRPSGNRGGYSDNNRGGGYSNNNRGGGGGYSNQSNRNNNNRNNSNRDFSNNTRRIQGPSEGPKKLLKPVKYKENLDPSTPLRLNKYLANAGVCSRREADSYITSGVVKVNGVIVNELGAKVTRGDLVTFNDQPVRLESKVYVLLNKPKNCVTTSDDPQNRLTVMDLVKNACPERIYPVGRLDRNTTGVLLLTNDGDLASKLMHPKFKKKKIYQVTLDRDVAIEDMQAIADGIQLDDGEIHADSIAYQAEDVLNVVGIEIHSGRNRVVRRIFEKLGYIVMKLDRVYFAGLTKKNVQRGKWRYLSEKEVNMLRMGAFE